MIDDKFMPGDGRSGYMQGLYQFVGIAVTFLISLLGGLFAGEYLDQLNINYKYAWLKAILETFNTKN